MWKKYTKKLFVEFILLHLIEMQELLRVHENNKQFVRNKKNLVQNEQKYLNPFTKHFRQELFCSKWFNKVNLIFSENLFCTGLEDHSCTLPQTHMSRYKTQIFTCIGTNCAPLIANLFLFRYERDVMLTLHTDT